MRPEEVVLAVHRPGPEFLVLLRSPERGGYWNLVAGGIEEGERPEDAARRELAEETALERPLAIEALSLELGYERPEGVRVTLHAFRVEAPAGWEPVLDEEHVEYRWCTPGAACELLAYPEPREAVGAAARLLGAAA